MSLVLSIIGAATGILALTAQVWQFRLSGPRIKVTLNNALVNRSSLSGQIEPRWYLCLNVSNVGRLPVTLLDVGIVVESGSEPGNMSIVPLDPADGWGPPVPHRLIGGEATDFFVAPVILARALEERRSGRASKGYVGLATGKTVTSRNRINVVNLAGMNAAFRRVLDLPPDTAGMTVPAMEGRYTTSQRTEYKPLPCPTCGSRNVEVFWAADNDDSDPEPMWVVATMKCHECPEQDV